MPDISDSISIAQSPSENTSPADAISLAFTETSLTQQALRTLAYDTGGQPILNSNNLETRVSQAVREYQNYYVLAWEPEAFEKDKPKFRKIEVSVKGRPELTVRVRRGFFGGGAMAASSGLRVQRSGSIQYFVPSTAPRAISPSWPLDLLRTGSSSSTRRAEADNQYITILALHCH